MSDWKGTKAPTATSRSSYAAAISRVLRKGGVPTRAGSSSRNREGVRVSQYTDTTARIVADFNTDGDARVMADAAEDTLHLAGHRTTRTTDSTLLVHRDGTAEESRDDRHLATERRDGRYVYPRIHGAQVSVNAEPDDRPIQVTSNRAELTRDEALKLAEQLYLAATGKRLASPR